MKSRAVSIHSDKLLVQTFIVMSLAFLFSISANAAPLKTAVGKKSVKAASAAGSLATAVKPDAKTKNDLDVGAGLTIGTNKVNTDNARQTYSGTYTFTPSLTHAPTNTSLSAALEYNREYSYQLDDGTDGDWGDGLIKLSKKIPAGGLVDNFILSPRIGIGLSKEAKRISYKGGLGSSFGVDKKIGIATLTQSVGYTYNLYEYDIRDDGKVNSPHSFAESTGISVQANKWLTVDAAFALNHTQSFQRVGRTFSTTAISATAALSKQVSIGIGATTLKKSTLEPSGMGNRIKLWDSTDAIATIDLSLSI